MIPPEAFSPPYVLAVGFIIVFAAMVHGTIGIGFPLVATPLLASVTDVRTAVLLLVFPTVAINIVNVIKGGNWSKSIAVYWPLAVYGMAGSIIGTRLLIVFPPEYFRPILAAMLIFYLNAERIGFRFAWIETSPGIGMAVFGLLAGLLGGTVNVMLPALVIFALEVRMTKEIMIQVFNFCFLFGKLTQGAVFLAHGFMTLNLFLLSLPLAAVGLIAMGYGMRIRDRIRADSYRRWLRLFLAIMAAVLFVQFFLG